MRYLISSIRRHLFSAKSLAVILFLLSASPGLAKDINIKTDISETSIWDSNPLMISSGEKSIYGSETKISSIIRETTPNTQINAGISVVRNQFNLSTFNSTDFHGNAEIVKSTELLTAILNANMDYDTTRTSELTTFAQNITSVRRTSYSLRPSISYNISQRGSIGLSGSWLETRYEDSSLSDYIIFTLVPSLAYNITPLQQAILSFQTQRYQTLEGAEIYTDSVGPSLGLNTSLTPALSTELSVGFLSSKSHGGVTSNQDRDLNYIFSGTLKYNDEQNTANIAALRSRQPFANGSESILTTFSIQEEHRFNSKLSLSLDGSHQFAKQSNISVNSLDKKWEGKSAISYKVSKKWDMTASYRYAKESLTGISKDPERNVVKVGLSYQLGFIR